ncbi:MAG: hypothetical protein Q9217_002515 [Psora testacea]
MDPDLARFAKPLLIMDCLRPALVALFVLSIPFIFNYVATTLFFRISHRSKEAVKTPPTIPHSIPILGSSLDLGFNALSFVESSTTRSGKQSPFRVALPNLNLYFVQGSDNIVSLWKKSGTTTGTPVHLFCLKYLFGMPREALEMYRSDNTGLGAQPVPGSLVAPRNRVDYRTHVGLLRFTNGTGLEGFYERWAAGFTTRLRSLDVGDEWADMPDLMTFFSDSFGTAVIESICGPMMIRLNPQFPRELSKYDQAMPGLLKGLPRWIIPHAYEARANLISCIRKWHDHAREQSQGSLTEDDGDADAYWGSAFMRERHGPHGIFASVDNFNQDSCAASDLGFIWAATTNLVPSAMWSTLETFKDPSLLARVRAEIKACCCCNPTALSEGRFDSQLTIQALPLMQSIYAETLRLRVRAYAARYTDREQIRLNEWIFPKESILLVSTTPAHIDQTFWNTKGGAHPVDRFWSDRFLVYPNDPLSGPLAEPMKQPTTPSPSDATAPKFSLAGTNGSWFPYGGGPRVCVGRAFSKRAIIAACAIMVIMFDIEILAEEKDLQMDPKFYGLGGQQPMGKVPFRIRRRKDNDLMMGCDNKIG